MLLIPGLNIVGILFILLGMKGLADHYKDGRIYRNAIIGTIFGITGLISISISIFFVLITIFAHSTLTGGSSVSYMPNVFSMLIAFTFISLMALFFRKAFHALAACSGLRLFRAVGILLFIGAIVPVLSISLATVLGIILRTISISYDTQTLLANGAMLLAVLGLFVGLLLVYITFALLAVAFFSLKQAHLNMPTTNAETAYCVHCGTLFSAENISVPTATTN
jgi:uncharacterized membrane protein